MAKTKKAVVETKKAVKKETKKAEPIYKVSLTYNGQTEVLKGDDLFKLFENWSPRIFKTFLLVKAEKGKQKVERRLSALQARKIAGNYTNAKIFAGNLLKFLNA